MRLLFSGVAVGSTIGHALGGFFGGGSAQGMEGQNSTTQGTMNSSGAAGCDLDAKAFTKCLDDNKDGQYQMQVCGWYLEQLVRGSRLNSSSSNVN